MKQPIRITVQVGRDEYIFLIRQDADADIPEILEVCTVDRRSGKDVPFVYSRISTKSSLETMALASHEIARAIQSIALRTESIP